MRVRLLGKLFRLLSCDMSLSRRPPKFWGVRCAAISEKSRTVSQIVEQELNNYHFGANSFNNRECGNHEKCFARFRHTLVAYSCFLIYFLRFPGARGVPRGLSQESANIGQNQLFPTPSIPGQYLIMRSIQIELSLNTLSPQPKHYPTAVRCTKYVWCFVQKVGFKIWTMFSPFRGRRRARPTCLSTMWNHHWTLTSEIDI